MQIKDLKIPGMNKSEPGEISQQPDTIPPMPPVPGHTLTRLTRIKDTEDEAPVKEKLPTRLINSILSMKCTLEQIADMQYFSIPRRLPDVFDTGSLTISIATATTPGSPDTISNAATATTGYDRVQVNHLLSRNSPRLTLVNDGPDTIYVISSDDGEKWSQTEVVIQYGEYRVFNNVFELRLRSPQLSSYRVTEGEIYTSYAIATADLNRPNFVTGRTVVPAIPVPTQLPAQVIPDGFALVIKALNTNVGRTYIGPTAAATLNPALSYSLGPNEFVSLKITNADLVYMYTALAGDGIEYVAEV